MSDSGDQDDQGGPAYRAEYDWSPSTDDPEQGDGNAEGIAREPVDGLSIFDSADDTGHGDASVSTGDSAWQWSGEPYADRHAEPEVDPEPDQVPDAVSGYEQTPAQYADVVQRHFEERRTDTAHPGHGVAEGGEGWQGSDGLVPGPHYVDPSFAPAGQPDYPIPPQVAVPGEQPSAPAHEDYPTDPRGHYLPGEQQYAPEQQYVPEQQYMPEQQYVPEQRYAPEQQYVAPPPHEPGRPAEVGPSGAAPHQGYPQEGYPQQNYPQQGYAQPGPATAPPPTPQPEDLLVPTTVNLAAEPASWGWRGKMNRASGGLFKAKPKQLELDARDAIKRIQRSFSRPMTVVVVQPKGGAGKTPTTVCLSAAFGAHRGGYVVGWDDNETRGTLAVRVDNPDKQQATVWDLLSDLSAFERYDARVGDLSYYVRAQPDSHFDALVSDDNPGNMAQIDEDAFQRLHTVLQRFYRLVVVDTGNNVRSPNWQAAVNAADQIVVVSTYQRDVGYSASWVLDHLAQTGREELARNAVTVLTAADPTTNKEVRAQLVGHFTSRTRSVVEIPFDPELAHGGPIRWTHMAAATRNAWIRAGATVVDSLADHDARTLQSRRS